MHYFLYQVSVVIVIHWAFIVLSVSYPEVYIFHPFTNEGTQRKTDYKLLRLHYRNQLSIVVLLETLLIFPNW